MTDFFVNDTPISSYCIVLPKDASFAVRLCAHRLQKGIESLCGVLLSVVGRTVCRKSPLRLVIDDKLPQSAYRLDLSEGGALTLSAGHYTGLDAACARLLTQIKEDAVAPFAGETDIPLSWQADSSLSCDMKNKQGEMQHISNEQTLSGFDYGASYRLVWNDEFDGTEIDLDKWSGCPNMVMPDVELSFEAPTVTLRDGKLVMVADWRPENDQKPYRTNYTVATHDTMNFSGGYLEMRAKVPCKQLGEWPSFWLNSGDTVLHKKWQRDALGYINDGGYYVEVDIFEQYSIPLTDFVPNLHKHFGASRLYSPRTDYEMRLPDGTWGPFRDPQRSGIDQGGIVSGTPVYRFADAKTANDWHTFGFLWTADRMAFSVDGVFYYSYAIDDDPTSTFNPLLRHKETGKEYQIDMTGYRRENIALSVLLNDMFFSPGYARTPGGKWCSNTYDETGKRIKSWRELNLEDRDRLFPLVYEVDYMRLYQTEGDTLYTPDTVGKTDRLYDGRQEKWDYALRGKK